MRARKFAILDTALILVVGCGAPKTHHQSSPKTKAHTKTKSSTLATTKAWAPHTWQVGNFTISTHLLPKVYDPNASWNVSVSRAGVKVGGQVDVM